jgi:hypothetical protein
MFPCTIGVGLLKPHCGIIQNLANHVAGFTRWGDDGRKSEGGSAALGGTATFPARRCGGHLDRRRSCRIWPGCLLCVDRRCRSARRIGGNRGRGCRGWW